MNNKIAIILAGLIVVLNAGIGHFFPPMGILLTPFVLTITTALVCFGTINIKVSFLGILTYLFVAGTDILIKLYSGDSHDNEGQGWIHYLFFIALIPTLGILLGTIFTRKDEPIRNKILATVLFVGLVILHLQLFGDLGCW